MLRYKYSALVLIFSSILVVTLISNWTNEKSTEVSLFVHDSLGKYDEPHVGLVPNDMVDNSMGRTFSYSTGDQDVREYKFMQKKFDRLQAILDSIQNGPTLNPPPPPEPEPSQDQPEPVEETCGGTSGIPCPARPKPGQPFLSYNQRIVRMLSGIQERINAAAKRQYILEDQVGFSDQYEPDDWQYCVCSKSAYILCRSLRHASRVAHPASSARPGSPESRVRRGQRVLQVRLGVAVASRRRAFPRIQSRASVRLSR